MSVIVKGMAMPESCEYCFFCMYMNCGYDVDYWCGIDNRPIENINIAKRLEDCPLVELPEKHGRLVDADFVTEKASHEAKAMGEPFKSNFDVLVEWIVDKTPTVIEAEGN